MRIKLKRGKQKQLICSSNLSLGELAKKIGVNKKTVYDWYIEKNLLPKKVYKILDKKEEFKKYILEIKEDNWGAVKGGYSSPGNTIKINKEIKFDERLAEFLGIMFGDGSSYLKKGRKIGVYVIRIVGDSRYDKEYLSSFVKNYVQESFGLYGKISYSNQNNGIILSFYSREFIEKLKNLGFPPGNKIKNKLKIPQWIKNNDLFLKSFIRGLIDTDGSIFRMSNKDPKLLRISLTNFIPGLLEDVRESLLKLGFHPSKIILNKHFYLSRKYDIDLYMKEIGFSNPKHINRFNVLRNHNSPVL